MKHLKHFSLLKPLKKCHLPTSASFLSACVHVHQERTRSALLETLYEELHVNSQAIMGVGGDDDKLENGSAGGGGFFESFKVTGKAGAEAGASDRRLHLPVLSELLVV